MPIPDTTILFDAKANPAKYGWVLDELANEEEAVLVPLQVAMEYAAGTKDVAQTMRELDASFDLVPFSAELAREGATLAKEAFAQGNFPGWGDIQIAATAKHHGMTIVTRNVKHLRDALSCRVWDYTRDRRHLERVRDQPWIR